LKYSDFVIQPLKNHRFKLLKSIKTKCGVIQKGYETDGASIPRILWCFLPPNRTDYLPCAVIHDWFCDKEEYKKADECFLDCLKELNVDKFTRTCLYYGVRIYHKIKYGV